MINPNTQTYSSEICLQPVNNAVMFWGRNRVQEKNRDGWDHPQAKFIMVAGSTSQVQNKTFPTQQNSHFEGPL